jgi:hypothetical protein
VRRTQSLITFAWRCNATETIENSVDSREYSEGVTVDIYGTSTGKYGYEYILSREVKWIHFNIGSKVLLMYYIMYAHTIWRTLRTTTCSSEKKHR